MKSNKISFENLKNIAKNFHKIKIHVVGDTIVDELLNTILIGGQIKTPTLSLLEGRLDQYAGGAAVVAANIAAAGAKVELTTMLGNDQNKNFVVKKLKELNVKLNFFKETDRPTTTKKVIIE